LTGVTLVEVLQEPNRLLLLTLVLHVLEHDRTVDILAETL
jgi:hypothetical protein